MDRLVSNFKFSLMSLMFKLRDRLLPRNEVLEEVGIEPGFQVLDYGCGPGGYLAATSELVGESGRVYALDVHPLAIQCVQRVVREKQLTNVETICSNCRTGLPDNSVDVVLLYDIFHLLSDPQAILVELRRVLKENGVLSFSDHHMDEREIISGVTKGQLFKLAERGEHTYSFLKQEPPLRLALAA